MTTAAPYRTPRALRRALYAVAALVALTFVAWSALSLLQVMTRSSSTVVDHYRGVRTLVLADDGDVRLTSAPAGALLTVRARVTESLITPQGSARRDDAGTLRLASSCRPAPLGQFCGVDYELAVPAGTAIRIRSSAGDIDAAGLRTTLPATLHSDAGDISVEGAAAPALTLSTSAGNVRAGEVDAARVTIDTSAGDVRLSLRGPPEAVDVHSGAGDVTLVVPDAVYRVAASSDAGTVDTQTVRTAPDAQRRIRADASAGDVRVEARR